MRIKNDLDQIVQRLAAKRFGGILGGGKGANTSSGGGGYVLIAYLVAVIAWGADGASTGSTKLNAASCSVLGPVPVSDTQPVTMPGLRWHCRFPMIETVDKVNVQEVNDYNFSTEMLTADEQYVFIDIVVQYRRRIR